MIDVELKKMTRNLFSEEFKSLEDKLPQKDFSKKIKLIKKEVFEVKKRFEKKISSNSSEIYEIILKNNFSINDFSYGKSGVMGFIKNSTEGISYLYLLLGNISNFTNFYGTLLINYYIVDCCSKISDCTNQEWKTITLIR